MRAGGSERRPGACTLERGRGVSGAARQCGGSERSELTAAAQRAHGRARSSACARAERGGPARERERRERKGVEKENKSQRFDSVQTQDFQLKLEKF